MDAPSIQNISRRDFMKVSLAAGVGLVVGFNVTPGAGTANAAETVRLNTNNILEPNAWIRIHPDSSVSVMVNHSEMGQGITTALSMIVADELGADWSKVKAEIAPAAKVYKNPAFGIQGTGGSTSVETCWDILRNAGAATRELLISAAADQWKVPVSECGVSKGIVEHKSSGRTIPFGNLLKKRPQ